MAYEKPENLILPEGRKAAAPGRPGKGRFEFA